MTLARYRLSDCSRVEREIIAVLRACRGGDGCPVNLVADRVSPWLGPLAFLARCAVEAGYDFRPIDAPHATEDELRIVGWLAYFQRERSDIFVHVDAAMRRPLTGCADALVEVGLRLPYRAVLRAVALTEKPVETAAETRASPSARPVEAASRQRAQWPFVRGALRARTIAYVREHGCVSTRTLGEIGVSRQYVAKLCLDGALQRVRHAHYRAANHHPLAAGPPAAVA